MNNTDAKSTKCDECGACHGMHVLACSRQTYEQMRSQVLDHYESWLSEHQRFNALHARLKEQITLWQGKCAILRHENNKLRDRNRKLENAGISLYTCWSCNELKNNCVPDESGVWWCPACIDEWEAHHKLNWADGTEKKA